MSVDAKQSVEVYLRKNGFTIEMETAKIFKQNGFDVYQSTFYIDKQTEKHRELDVIAYFTRYIGDVQFEFKIIIECKYALTPWILFSGDEGFESLQIDTFYCSNHAGRKLLERLNSQLEFQQGTWFKARNHFGYGLKEIKSGERKEDKKESLAFGAISTLINALEYEKKHHEIIAHKKAQILIPVIVIKGKLFDVQLNGTNETEINEINEGQLLYKSNIYPSVFPLIEIITTDMLANFVQKLKKDLDTLFTDYNEIIHSFTTDFPVETNPYKFADY